MFRNYLKVAMMDLRKNLLFSSINIFGLAVSLAACMILVIYVSFELSYDRFHTNEKKIFRLGMTVRSGTANSDNAGTYPVLRNLISDHFPEVQHCLRLRKKKGIVMLEEKPDVKFSEDKILYADDNFFQVFDFPLVVGDPGTALTRPDAVVITESMVQRYFGSGTEPHEVIGRYMRKIGTTENELLMITGVCRDVPENSHFDFDFLISFKSIYNWKDQDDSDYKTLAEQSTEWPGFYTYILLQDQSDASSIANLEKKVSDAFVKVIPEYQRASDYIFFLQPLRTIHLDSHLAEELGVNGSKKDINSLTAVSVLLLIIAIVNYVNLSSAKTSERFKEVGVRKTLGAKRGQIILQFLTEAFIFSVVSMFLALAFLSIFWFLLRGQVGIEFDYAFWRDPVLYVFGIASILLTTLLYSIYPMSLLSTFNPIIALRGGIFGTTGGRLREVLVVFQFVITTTLIAGTLVIYRQTTFMKDGDTGLKTKDLLVVRAPKVPTDRDQYLIKSETFKNEALKLASVSGVTMGVRIPGEDMATHMITREDSPEGTGQLMRILGVDHDYLETLELNIIAGQGFLKTTEPDKELMVFNESKVNFGTHDHSVIINESAAKQLGFESPDEAVGQRIFIFGVKKVIVGVVQDYYHKSMKEAIQPTVLYIQLVYAGFYMASIDQGANLSQVVSHLKNAWTPLYPMDPFEFFFLEDFYNEQYRSETRFEKVFLAFTILIVIMSCLGLYALSLFTMMKRSKEIAIRKIVGASFGEILKTMASSFVRLVLIALFISSPLIYLVFSSWLYSYPLRISLDVWVILIPAIVVLALTITIVALQTFRTVGNNSIRYLRSE